MDRRDTIFRHFLDGLTYAAIAKKVGLSRQRVQQIVRPPKPIYDAVKARAHGKCESCEIHIQDGHVHHIEADGRTVETFNDLHNLLYLCPACHRRMHAAGPSHDGRVLQIGVRVTPREKREFQQMARKESVSVSEWLRRLAYRELSAERAA